MGKINFKVGIPIYNLEIPTLKYKISRFNLENLTLKLEIPTFKFENQLYSWKFQLPSLRSRSSK